MTKAILLASACFVALSAQTADAERIRITGGNVIDVTSGEITAADIIIVDDRIVPIGSAWDTRAEATDRTIDMDGAYILPGLSDSHVHLTSRADVHGYRRLTCLLYTSPSPRDS